MVKLPPCSVASRGGAENPLAPAKEKTHSPASEPNHFSRDVMDRGELRKILECVFKISCGGFPLISTGFQPGDAGWPSHFSRFSGFQTGGKAVETAADPTPMQHRAEARC